MAFFSRRPKKDGTGDGADAVREEPVVVEPAAAQAPEPAASGPEAPEPAAPEHEASEPGPDPEEPVPHVGISVSTYGARTPGGPPAVPAAPPAETIPGLRDNVLLRETLARMSRPPTSTDVVNAARQLLQGHVFLRVKGDARALLAAGSDLPLSIAKRGDDAVLLAYSSGAALRAAVRSDGDTATSAVAQPVLTVVRQALSGPYTGILLDHASTPATVFLSRDVLSHALEQADDALALKTLLVGARDAGTPSAVVTAMASAPMWVAARRADDGRLGIAGCGTRAGCGGSRSSRTPSRCSRWAAETSPCP